MMQIFKSDSSIYAKSVEQCFCPKGYQNSSCEECATGYYRAKVDGKGIGYCIPCRCNGHSEECDVNTGQCIHCVHNTTGDHCDQCIEGYYGDATRGSSLDCMICPCPLAQESNNFALSCELNSFKPQSLNLPEPFIDDSSNALISNPSSPLLPSRFTCKCRKGYIGPICAECDTGYYGQPFVNGDYVCIIYNCIS